MVRAPVIDAVALRSAWTAPSTGVESTETPKALRGCQFLPTQVQSQHQGLRLDANLLAPKSTTPHL